MNTVTITIGNEVYTSWPKLAIESPLNIYGQLQCLHLNSLLHEAFPTYVEWREMIPSEIRNAIVRMPEARGELLLLAQAWPERFLDIYTRAPAWLLLAANFWMFEYPRRQARPSGEEREDFYHWFYLAPKRKVFAKLGFDTHQKVRLLGKVTRGSSLIDTIFCLRRTLFDQGRSRLLTHIPRLEGGTIRVASRRVLGDDYQLLNLASKRPFDQGETVEALLNQIEDWLARAGRQGQWPYKGRVRSWATLRRIRTKLQLECGSEDPFETYHPEAVLCEPPFCPSAAKDEFGIVVEPLNTAGLLEEESGLMSNCSVTYSTVLKTMDEFFLYRVVEPFRATLLIHRVEGVWMISQLYGPANSDVEPEERGLVEKWLEWANLEA